MKKDGSHESLQRRKANSTKNVIGCKGQRAIVTTPKHCCLHSLHKVLLQKLQVATVKTLAAELNIGVHPREVHNEAKAFSEIY